MSTRKIASVCLLAMLTLAAVAQAQPNLLINGNWETGDETGWTRTTQHSWGSGFTWTVVSPGAGGSPYAGKLNCNQGSFGWYQVVQVPVSYLATVEADWSGNLISWAEVMLFTFDHQPTAIEVEGVFGPGPVSAIAYKKDRFGMNPPKTWDWQKASLSPHPEGNGGTVTSLGWVVVGLKLGDNNADAAWASWDNVTLTAEPGGCQVQHATSGITPSSVLGDRDVTLTVTGTDLELVTGIRLSPAAGGSDIVGTNMVVGPGPGETMLTADFATNGAPLGSYHVITEQPEPCLPWQLSSAFAIVCPNPTSVTGLSPDSLTDPSASTQITISGSNLDAVSGVSLEFPIVDPSPMVVAASSTAMVENDLVAIFDLSCAWAAPYRLVCAREDGCDTLAVESALWLRKTPLVGRCTWQPWAVEWSVLNKGDDVDPPNGVYGATNWDYSLSQQTVLDTPRDTPDGSSYALHWFFDAQPPESTSNRRGTGGVFQEIAVEPGVVVEYSFQWKGACTGGTSWFEFLLIDGPFTLAFADMFVESSQKRNNPMIVRKKEFTATGFFAWEQVTDQSPADLGPYGLRPQTITPASDVVTVVLKGGRSSDGGMESFWDNVVVRQNGGANLIVNGDFEDTAQVGICNTAFVFQDACEHDSWRQSSFKSCPNPFADADEDGDVDQGDFAVFQACFTGAGLGPVPELCKCFDRPEAVDPDGDVDTVDLMAFETCASGPGVPANKACDD